MRLPHEREPDRESPDVCVYCRIPWCDLFTDRPEDECPVRLRAALDATPLRWERHANNPTAYRLILGSGPNEITVGRMRSWYDRHIGHVVTVSVGDWAETAQWDRNAAADHLCRRIGIGPVSV